MLMHPLKYLGKVSPQKCSLPQPFATEVGKLALFYLRNVPQLFN